MLRSDGFVGNIKCNEMKCVHCWLLLPPSGREKEHCPKKRCQNLQNLIPVIMKSHDEQCK